MRDVCPLAARFSSFLKSRVLFVVVALFALGTSAAAQTNIYHIRGNAAAGSNNIWSINPTTGAQTLVYTGYPGGNAATLAQRASDGMLFYAINNDSGSNGAVYRFNPATPAVAPVLLGTLGAGVSSGFRMAFNGNTLYFMPGGNGADNDRLYTVNTTTGVATAGPNITGTGNGGDMTFIGNTLYIINQNRQLYSATTAGGAATLVGTVTFPGGATPGTLGLAPDSAGRLLIQTQNPSNLYRITLPSMTSTLFAAAGGGTTSTGDMASANVPAPDISVTKTDGVTNTYQGATVTYTVTVRNNGAYTVSANLTDTVPASLTGVTWTCVASAGSTCDAASGSGNAISTGATLEASDTATYTVTGTVNVSSGSIANTATVALDATWLTESNTTNNSATDTDTVVAAANVSITKTAANAFVMNSNDARYTLAVANAGPQSAAGTITVSDTLPAGLTFFSATGTNWTCSALGQVVTCTHPGPIASGASLPNITLRTTVGLAAAPSVSNTATVSSPTFDPVAANNSSTATTPILYISLQKSYTLSGPQPTPGTEITYTVAFSNLGGTTVQNFYLVDVIPFSVSGSTIVRSTEFKVGSMTFAPGSTALTLPVAGRRYFSDAINFPAPTPPWNPATTYTPVGAYDPAVSYVGWQFSGTMAPGTSGSVTFTVRIR